ncbi:TNF receptor-associated factor 2-like isoform X2 [Pocillopora verrucosa]
MMTFRVFCQANEENECLWKGPLGELEDHRSECPFVMVGCTYDCGKQVKRKDLQQHTATECLLRKISCDYCNEAVLWNELEQHFENCSKYPQQCNMCGKDGIERGKMEYHLERVCVNVRIKCPLHTSGCSFEGLRSDVHKHITEELSSHVGNCLKYKSESDNGNNFPQLQEDQEGRLTQLQQSELEELKNHYTQLSNVVHLLECQLKETKEAQMRLETPLREQEIMLRKQAGRFCNGTYTWRIEKFRDCYEDAISGTSPTKYSSPFYTSLHCGYNLCMRINMDGVDDGVGKHVALFIHLMRGDHDDFLQWPFAKKFRLSILNQSGDEGEHHDISKTLVAEPKWKACQRPEAPHNYYGLGYPKFAPIELICQPQYTKNDTLLVKFEMIG